MPGVNNKRVLGVNSPNKLLGASRPSSREDGIHLVLLSSPHLRGGRKIMPNNSKQVAGVRRHKERLVLLNNLLGERRMLHNSNRRQVLGALPPPNLLIPGQVRALSHPGMHHRQPQIQIPGEVHPRLRHQQHLGQVLHHSKHNLPMVLVRDHRGRNLLPATPRGQ